MEIRRSGNFGFIDTGGGQVYSFDISGRGRGWEPTSIPLVGGRSSFFQRRMTVAGYEIVPMGDNNDLPGHVMRLLDHFYAGEGIMGKIAGLQWGDGPRFYRDAIDTAGNRFYKQWTLDAEVEKDLERWDYKTFMHHCLVDLVHMQGFFVKFVRNRAPRAGGSGRILRLEHIPYQRARLLYPPEGTTEPQGIVVGDFPFPDPQYMAQYPMFDPQDPFRHPVSAKYYNIYSFAKDFMSTPRFLGAFDWLEIAGTLAPLLHSYNLNSSALSLHIESPQGYWDKAEERLKAVCARRGEAYSSRMLEEYKDVCMEKFAGSLTGMKNVGKYMHTTRFWSDEANNFEGWTVTPIDKKVKDYIEAQIQISNKADAAATSGFGIDPVLANLIMENKLSSGSEKLYSIKVYNASETAIPDMILCKPVQDYIRANFPASTTRIGLYRTVVNAEENVSPQNRMKNTE
ncbi:MAG: hypothetical protein Q4D56_12845 [Bacteroides sp.]|nr:hypothetical protein [Bacteroides sp.]